MTFARVAIVGGGFSGAMTAVNLARFGGPAVTLFEREGVFGPGVAFGGRDRGQVLNVRSSNMSAYPDDPGHFERWLALNGPEERAFARRTEYGRYLAEEFDRACSQRNTPIERVADEAVEAVETGRGWRIACRSGPIVEADALILANGLLPPLTPAGIAPDRLPKGTYVADPWREDFAADLLPGAKVLLIGTGLTMVDVALALAELPGIRIEALSRRGLLPRAHAAPGPLPPLADTPEARVSTLLATIRDQADRIGWRAAIDRLRPHTQTLWQRFSTSERGRFLRHLRPFWDVHRHRMAPELAERIDGLQERGVLSVHTGRLESAAPSGSGVRVIWQPRGTAARVADEFARVINCTGPATLDPQSGGPLLGGLLASGHVVRDAMGLGIEVDEQSRVIDAHGRADPTLYALGAMTRGKFWEISAVPDIRVQAWSLARRLSNAHWVEGEGL